MDSYLLLSWTKKKKKLKLKITGLKKNNNNKKKTYVQLRWIFVAVRAFL